MNVLLRVAHENSVFLKLEKVSHNDRIIDICPRFCDVKIRKAGIVIV